MGETPKIDLRTNLQCDADFLVFMSGAYMLSAALFTAVEIGIFDALEESPTSADELAARIGAAPNGVDRILTTLASLGLVDRDAHGSYRNQPLASQLLTRTSPHNVCSFLLYQQRHVVPLFSQLSASVQTGQPRVDDYYGDLTRDARALRLFLEAMNTAARGLGSSIAQQVDLASIATLLDLGGGGGQVALELARAAPHVAITLVEQAAVCGVTARFLGEHGVGDRVHVVPGDFMDELPVPSGAFDAVLLSGVLADFDAPGRRRLLRHAQRCLRSDGTLLVSETLLDDDGRGPVLPALLSLTLLVGTRGKNFARAELCELLRGAGFEVEAVHDNRRLGVRDLVVARRR